MSFRENTANWHWRYFFGANIPDVLENLTGFIDESLDLGDGSKIEGKPFEFSRDGMMRCVNYLKY